MKGRAVRTAGLGARAMEAIERGDHAAAHAAYVELVREGGGTPEVFNNLAALAQRRGDRDEAIEHLREAVKRAPGRADLRGALAALLERRIERRWKDAEWCGAAVDLAEARALRGDTAELAALHAGALLRAGRAAESLAAAEAAVRLGPGELRGEVAQGRALEALGRHADASAAAARALAIDGGDPEALHLAALVAQARGAWSEAIALLERGLVRRGDAGLFNDLGAALVRLGEIAAAEAAYREALRRAPGAWATRSNLLLALHYDGRATPEAIAAEHRAFGEALSVHAAARPISVRDPRPDRRLRVGYLSPDFRQHSVIYFIDPVIAAHDRREVEVVCYSDAPRGDELTARIEGLADEWRDVHTLDDAGLVAQIEADRIDVLVELAGHTAGNRLAALARRAAPVQVTYLGYPDTTGLSTIDLRVTDEVADPEGASEAWHTERLARLRGGFLCYRPPVGDASLPVAPAPVVRGGPFTFGSFNNAAKLSDACLEAWAAILARTPGSRLVLKAAGLADARARRRLLAHFAANGVDEPRVELRARVPAPMDHLALYGDIDLALDSFPYNGTTTTCEALWMGVPVLTVAGRTHAGRVGASLLRTVGLDELVAPDVEGYVAAAVAWAERPEALARWRATMRGRLSASPLLDARRVAGALEGVYRRAWRARCAGQTERLEGAL